MTRNERPSRSGFFFVTRFLLKNSHFSIDFSFVSYNYDYNHVDIMHRFFFLAFFLFEFILFPWSRKSVFSTLNQMVSLLPIFRIFNLFIQTHNPMKFSNVLDLKQKIFVIL